LNSDVNLIGDAQGLRRWPAAWLPLISIIDQSSV